MVRVISYYVASRQGEGTGKVHSLGELGVFRATMRMLGKEGVFRNFGEEGEQFFDYKIRKSELEVARQLDTFLSWKWQNISRDEGYEIKLFASERLHNDGILKKNLENAQGFIAGTGVQFFIGFSHPTQFASIREISRLSVELVCILPG